MRNTTSPLRPLLDTPLGDYTLPIVEKTRLNCKFVRELRVRYLNHKTILDAFLDGLYTPFRSSEAKYDGLKMTRYTVGYVKVLLG